MLPVGPIVVILASLLGFTLLLMVGRVTALVVEVERSGWRVTRVSRWIFNVMDGGLLCMKHWGEGRGMARGTTVAEGTLQQTRGCEVSA